MEEEGKSKITAQGVLLAILIALGGWTLREVVALKTEVAALAVRVEIIAGNAHNKP